MAEKPILFNTKMVRAILDGRKRQTRRIIKGLPLYEPYFEEDEGRGFLMDSEDGQFYALENFSKIHPGDVLWVRETWQRLSDFGEWRYEYRADYEDDDPLRLDGMYITWRPSIHMPREAARIFLKVKDVRAERLQDMTPEECANDGGFEPEAIKAVGIAPLFGTLWNSTVNKDAMARWGWAANPWVWVIEFERIDRN
jgi:hypothetical protein